MAAATLWVAVDWLLTNNWSRDVRSFHIPHAEVPVRVDVWRLARVMNPLPYFLRYQNESGDLYRRIFPILSDGGRENYI